MKLKFNLTLLNRFMFQLMQENPMRFF